MIRLQTIGPTTTERNDFLFNRKRAEEKRKDRSRGRNASCSVSQTCSAGCRRGSSSNKTIYCCASAGPSKKTSSCVVQHGSEQRSRVNSVLSIAEATVWYHILLEYSDYRGPHNANSIECYHNCGATSDVECFIVTNAICREQISIADFVYIQPCADETPHREASGDYEG